MKVRGKPSGERGQPGFISCLQGFPGTLRNAGILEIERILRIVVILRILYCGVEGDRRVSGGGGQFWEFGTSLTVSAFARGLLG